MLTTVGFFLGTATHWMEGQSGIIRKLGKKGFTDSELLPCHFHVNSLYLRVLGSMFQINGGVDADITQRIDKMDQMEAGLWGPVWQTATPCRLLWYAWVRSHERTRLGMITSGGEQWDVLDVRDKMREYRLRWFGHAMRRSQEELVKAILELRVGGSRSRDRPKRT